MLKEKFRKSAALNPLNPITPFLWGLILFEQEKYDEAINKFNHCSTYTDNKYDSLYYTALCYLKKSDYKSALDCAQKANKEDKTNVDPYIIMADCYLNTGKKDDCLRSFVDAESNAITNARFYTNWGMALQKYGYIDEAREKLYKALMIEPNQETVLFNLGVNFMLARENTQAEEFFSKVLELNPQNPQALFNLATLAYNRLDFDYALKSYLAAYDADKKNYAVYFNIANCYHRKKEYSQAKVYFKKCIEYCPKFIQAYLNYANLLLELGENTEAKRKARAAFLLDKDSSYTNFAYGVVLLKIGEYIEAKEKFETVLKIDSSNDMGYLGLCEVHLNLKQYDKCFENLLSVSKEGRSLREFDELETRTFAHIANPEENNEEISNDVINHAFEYCNKILESYNNDKVLAFRNILSEKYNFEANQ